MKPFLKWAGGKRWFISNHSNFFPVNYKRYIEPFVGSGAVFFRLCPSYAVLSDTNPELIDTYSTLRESPEKVWQILRRHQNKHSNAYYYKIRASKPRTPASKAARFIYLNRTCFNGLYRVNLRGEFNVPKGTKDNVIFPDDNFPAISAALQGVNMYVQDFAETIRSAQQGDFVFVDPPYTVQHNNNNFIKYNEKLFTWADQERLSEGLALACKRGALVLLTNADNKCIRKLYSSRIWAQFHVNRQSVLASDMKRRGEITELVISNYLTRKGKQVTARF